MAKEMSAQTAAFFFKQLPHILPCQTLAFREIQKVKAEVIPGRFLGFQLVSSELRKQKSNKVTNKYFA